LHYDRQQANSRLPQLQEHLGRDGNGGLKILTGTAAKQPNIFNTPYSCLKIMLSHANFRTSTPKYFHIFFTTCGSSSSK